MGQLMLVIRYVALSIIRDPTWFQFHQHSTSSFYVRRSQKRKKTVKLSAFFALLESALTKAACKMLMKLTTGVNIIIILGTAFVRVELECSFWLMA